jgi:prephenate dehydrogenase
LILDLSLLKSRGQQWADKFVERGHYVGVCPILAADFLADGRSSLEAASPDLFRNSIFCIMASARTDPQAVETAINVGRSLGAKPYFLDAAEFDGLVQGVETLPRLAAAALFQAAHKAAGWRDTARFAGLTFAQSTSFLEANEGIVALALHDKTITLRWLDSLITELQEVKRWLYHEDEETLAAILETLSIDREKWLHERRKNDWLEGSPEEIEVPSIFGSFWGRRPKKNEN